MKPNSTRAAAAVWVGVVVTAATLNGLYVMSDVRTVPVARLASNLEKQLATNPKDADVHVNLARLYGMAYAVNSDELPVLALDGTTGANDAGRKEEVWFGHEPNLIPYRAQPSPDADRGRASKTYLQKSVEHYRAALHLNPDSLLARLGYGWTLEQSGDKPGAIEQYRRVIEVAWPKEQNSRMARLGQRFYTQETAGYLIPLLDPERDASEISELKARASRLERMPRPITPIAVPLSASATPKTIVDIDAQVRFDADGRGLLRRWTWITREAGWLVYDPAQKGQITSALQWFGDVTFWLFWNNGYDALAALDDNGDRELAGTELRHLAVWHDVNSNGVSDRGEVRSLADHRIVSLSCNYTAGDGLLVSAESSRGLRLKDGTTRATYDVILRPSAMVSAPAPE
jgi:tetratricopeptide (TPR) repeat protein